MKRSKMIDKLSWYIEQIGGDSYDKAKSILLFLEHQGMQAPSWHGKFTPGSGREYHINGWEPENESETD